ncbi:hypothetical protein H3005_06385 [Stenotrophomonas sp. Br8]|uniref:hypothetical protein n=1 Tax=Stenotrophomonas sp. Br8 TaxID=2759658 RepID=UPI00168AE012|nr:hypothetical protein [Stenotrophomonas sp. Br8]MBD3681491.1 hypothetical protein [Stenotrophomonas sp. Br8]
MPPAGPRDDPIQALVAAIAAEVLRHLNRITAGQLLPNVDNELRLLRGEPDYATGAAPGLPYPLRL